MENNTTAATVYEDITGTNGRYRWTKYHNIRVIEDTTNGYINATKMCAMYGRTKGGKEKQFHQWKLYNHNFIKLVCSRLSQETKELINVVTGGQIEVVRGSYVHRDIAVNVALWCGVDIQDNDVLQNNQRAENELKRQQTSQSGYVYVLQAPMFSYYGQNVYKIGYTVNLRKRMHGFIAIPGVE